tara:strand:+ start:234 stop:377 length:144 start_codon:yes stop_codon:yes gene_type:complete
MKKYTVQLFDETLKTNIALEVFASSQKQVREIFKNHILLIVNEEIHV